jgi:hypothetical protein
VRAQRVVPSHLCHPSARYRSALPHAPGGTQPVLLRCGAGCCRVSLHRLVLDEERHVISFSIVGGNHHLANYRSVPTIHPSPTGNGTVVIECYAVDVSLENTHTEHLFISRVPEWQFCNFFALPTQTCLSPKGQFSKFEVIIRGIFRLFEPLESRARVTHFPSI